MARPPIRKFADRQISVNRLMVALDNLGTRRANEITSDELEKAYSAVDRQITAKSKSELKSELEYNEKRITELEAKLKAAKNKDAALKEADDMLNSDSLFDKSSEA